MTAIEEKLREWARSTYVHVSSLQRRYLLQAADHLARLEAENAELRLDVKEAESEERNCQDCLNSRDLIIEELKRQLAEVRKLPERLEFDAASFGFDNDGNACEPIDAGLDAEQRTELAKMAARLNEIYRAAKVAGEA